MRARATRLAAIGGIGSLRQRALSAATVATRAYIAAVEAADGAQLEPAVLAAIVPFANWRIPLGGACCILAGARTLAGALVPLVGPAPTGVNLVEADYSRRRVTLNGSTKAIQTNTTTGSVMPDEESCHFAINIRDSFTTSGQVFLEGGLNIDGHVTLLTPSGGGSLRVRLFSQQIVVGSAPISDGEYIFARTSPTQAQLLTPYSPSVVTGTPVFSTPVDHAINIGANANLSSHAPLALSLYSFGAYLDPAIMRDAMSTLQNAIIAATP